MRIETPDDLDQLKTLIFDIELVDAS